MVQNSLWVLFEALSAPVHLVSTPLVQSRIVVNSLLLPRENFSDASDHLTVRIGLLVPVAGVFTRCIPSFALLHATGAEVLGARLCPEF